MLADAYKLHTPEDNINHYATWANTYEKDLEDYGYVAPQRVVSAFREHFSQLEGKILDAGCGTGLVNDFLKQQPAFKHIDGMDISQEMLDEARKRSSYDRLFTADLTNTIDVVDAHYDAIISVGTFTHGHVGPSGLRELLRCTKPGGIVCISVNAGVWESDGYEPYLETLKMEGMCTIVEVKESEYLLGTACKGYIVTLKNKQ